MQKIMHRKGFLKGRKEGKSFLFWLKVEKLSVMGGMMSDLMSRLLES